MDRYRDLVARDDGAASGSPDRPIPTLMEFRGTPNPAAAGLNDLKRAMAEQDFSSKSEAENFIAQYMEGMNSRAKTDFLGLSSDQMRRLLSAFRN